MRSGTRLMGLAVLLLTARIVNAQTVEPAAVRLTLEDAQARALAASHRLAESRARQRVAEAAVDARTAAQLPSVAASAGYTRTNHVTEFVLPHANIDDWVFGVAAVDAQGHESSVSVYRGR